MGQQHTYTGYPNDYGRQYTGYRQEDEASNGRDFRSEGGYFNDGYGGEEQSLDGDVDEYEEYTFEQRGNMFPRR
jgi:hypothetical protein